MNTKSWQDPFRPRNPVWHGHLARGGLDLWSRIVSAAPVRNANAVRSSIEVGYADLVTFDPQFASKYVGTACLPRDPPVVLDSHDLQFPVQDEASMFCRMMGAEARTLIGIDGPIASELRQRKRA